MKGYKQTIKKEYKYGRVFKSIYEQEYIIYTVYTVVHVLLVCVWGYSPSLLFRCQEAEFRSVTAVGRKQLRYLVGLVRRLL